LSKSDGDQAAADPRLDNIQAVWNSYNRFQAVLSPEAVELLAKAFNISAVLA
jgi:predicted transcriptional regulator